MSVKYRKLFWPTVVLIAVASSTLALVSIRTRKSMPRVDAQSLVASEARTDKPRLPSSTLKSPAPQTGEEFKTASAPGDTVPPSEGQPSKDPVEVEVITVRPSGFEPREITRRHGDFMLAITNHTGANELALRLDRVQGNHIHEVQMPKGRLRWNKVFNLPPGEYVLSEQNHPDWICRIKLTAK